MCAVGPEAEPRGECYSVACTRFQAGRIFAEMVAIITRTPWLNDRINIVRFRKELEDTFNGSTFDVLSADVAPVHGLSPSFVCYDELAQVPNRSLYDALGTALGGRAQPLMLVISTQAARDEAPMSELIDYGLRKHDAYVRYRTDVFRNVEYCQPVGKRRCPKCGWPMFLSSIAPSDQVDHDERTFECSTCAYAETATVKFR